MLEEWNLLRNHFETIVVGAGPSGLAAAYCLKQNCVSYTIIEGSSRVANSWHYVWDGFKLAQKASEVYMPGLDLTEKFDPDYHLTRDEIITTLEGYAKNNELEIKFNIQVQSIKKSNLDTFEIETTNGKFIAANIILGLGARQQPKYPECITPSIQSEFKPIIMHSAWYQDAKSLAKCEKILVIGSGLSALSITKNLIDQPNVHYKVSIACAYDDKEIAINNKHLPVIPVRLAELEERGVENFGKLQAYNEDMNALQFSLKQDFVKITNFAKIIFATGYSYVYDLLFKLLDIKIAQKILNHDQGVTEEPGVYAVGVPTKGDKTVTITKGSFEAEKVVLNIVKKYYSNDTYLTSTATIKKLLMPSNDTYYLDSASQELHEENNDMITNEVNSKEYQSTNSGLSYKDLGSTSAKEVNKENKHTLSSV